MSVGVTGRGLGDYINCTHQSPLGFDERSVLSVHFVVQTAGIAQIVAGPIPPPQGGGGSPTVDALPTLCQIKSGA